MTTEERAEKNEEGERHGCAVCPVCGDSAWWKKFHTTVFEAGVLVPDHAVKTWKRWKPPSPIGCQKGISVLCEECWNKIPAVEREKHYTEHSERTRKHHIKSVMRLRHPETGRMIEHPEDAQRHRRETEEWQQRHDKIMAALAQEK